MISYTSTTSSVTSAIQITKELTGRDLVANEFHFEMNEVEGKAESATGTNDANGTVTMSSITFEKPGEYVYEIKETKDETNVYDGITYDTSAYQVKATVEDNGAGQLEVTWISLADKDLVYKNTYEAKPTAYQFGAMKVINGRELKENEFEFVLKDSKGRVVDTARNHKNGAVQFKPIEFKEPGKYTYRISEVVGHEKYMDYDEYEYTVVLEVTDDQHGNLHVTRTENQDTMVFVNTYNKPEDPKPAPKPTPRPHDSGTGYATDATAWLGLMAVSGTALAGVSYKKRKNKK